MNTENLITVLTRADMGQLLQDANEDLKKLAAAVMETDGKGKVTISISMAKVKGKQALEVTPILKTDIPAPPRTADWYFADDDGTVSRKDPRQPDLPHTDNVENLNR